MGKFSLGAFQSLRRPAGALSTQFGSYSGGYGKGGKVDDNCDGFDLDICPDLLLAGLALAAAGAFVALFTAITMAAAGRRKRRSLPDPKSVSDMISDVYWLGNPTDHLSILHDQVTQHTMLQTI